MKLQTLLPYFIACCLCAVAIALAVFLYFYCKWLFYIFAIFGGIWLSYGLLYSISAYIVRKKPNLPEPLDEELMRDHLILRKSYNSKVMRTIQRVADNILTLLNHIP